MKLRTRLRHITAAITGRTPGTPRVFGRYAGADHSRIVANWFAALADPNEEIRGALSDLRARSRQLVRDNGEAAGLLLDFESDIVGAQGARLQFRARRPRGSELTPLNDRVERAFWDWSQSGVCTLGDALSFTALQRLMLRTVITDGEFLAEKVRDPSLRFGFALAPLDPDQLDESYNQRPTAGGNAIVMGVELDGNGRPVAYHVWDRHPSLPGKTRRTIPASSVVHVFKRVRVGQVRGIPWFAPALVTWKLGDRYTEAELYQSLLAAAQGGFFENQEGGQLDIPRDESGKPIPLVLEAEPGTARALPSGWSFKPWQPTHPTANYVGFMKAVKRVIARAFGRSYATLTGDLSDVNFSSMRTDRVREMQQNRMHQVDLLIEQFCQPIFTDWLRMAALVGQLGASAVAPEDVAYFQNWMCAGSPWIDPVKDATAALMELNMGVTSPQRICAEKGRDYFDVIDEIAEARQYALDAGVPLEAVPLAITVTADATANPDAGTTTPTTNTGRVLPLRKEVA